MVLVALDVLIALVRLRNWVRNAFGKDTWAGFDKGRVALVAGGAVALTLIGLFGLLAIAVGLAVTPFALIGYGIARLIAIGARLFDWWHAQDWGKLGSRILDGIVRGLRNGVGKAWDAIKSLARGLEDRFKETLGIHSPSRVFMRHGRFIALGAAAGINAGRVHAERAAMRLADGIDRAGTPSGFDVGGYSGAATGMAAGAAVGGGAAAAGANTPITFGDVHVHASDAAGGRAAALAFRQQVEELFMGVNVHLGGRRPAGA
jgi:hypothetical protein